MRKENITVNRVTYVRLFSHIGREINGIFDDSVVIQSRIIWI